ncbi:MAG TPA: hypothetical protein VMZ73_07020 [Acidimicrobiales bacterium]|nr:hypothetical protein [Acidimicrobiales bacterium]
MSGRDGTQFHGLHATEAGGAHVVELLLSHERDIGAGAGKL